MTPDDIANALAWHLFYQCEDPIDVGETDAVQQWEGPNPCESRFVVRDAALNGLGETPDLYEVTISVRRL
jgi:hypothetical protein